MDNEKILSLDEIDTIFGTFSILFDEDILYGISTALSGELIEKRFPFYFKKSGVSRKSSDFFGYGGEVELRVKRKKLPESMHSQFMEYFSGKRTSFQLKTVLEYEEAILYFSEFELSVWHILKGIPFGETRTYGWLAKEIGIPSAQRAVGQALKKNPLPIVIPCHRIVGSGGALCGYSLGIELKRRLIMHEYYSRVEGRKQGSLDTFHQKLINNL